MKPRMSAVPALIVAAVAAARIAFYAPPAHAEADGPDHFALQGVAPDDVLNMRAEPSVRAPAVGAIAPGATCVRNLGCRGGLSYQEFTALSPAQRQQRLRENPRWCRVEYRGVKGWVAGSYLVEGSCAR